MRKLLCCACWLCAGPEIRSFPSVELAWHICPTLLLFNMNSCRTEPPLNYPLLTCFRQFLRRSLSSPLPRQTAMFLLVSTYSLCWSGASLAAARRRPAKLAPISRLTAPDIPTQVQKVRIEIFTGVSEVVLRFNKNKIKNKLK